MGPYHSAQIGIEQASRAMSLIALEKALLAPLACACPGASGSRSTRYVPRTDRADVGRAMVARLGLGLLLLALLLPTQTYSNQPTVITLTSNSSQNTSAAPNPANATTKAIGSALQSTASLLVISLSLLHLYH
ncbi:signal transducer CD24-like [Tupaia chinensis]|uniref:signal transducer CD24-like n=1 Tax=Tupaia chinensis TaxID=246437 RepID=UPI0003C91D5B|nr:signal transducer CD24-like [Tupaia chinensis]